MERESKERFVVYLLRNAKGRFYVGQTSALDARLRSHNAEGDPEGKWTRKHGPWEVVWNEEHPDRASAMRREREIKSWKSARSIRERLLGEHEG